MKNALTTLLICALLGVGCEDATLPVSEVDAADADAQLVHTCECCGRSVSVPIADESERAQVCSMGVCDNSCRNDCATSTEPAADQDSDGLTNVLEDRNLNCIVDADETDWESADTDGDGRLDGDEDINRNGTVENGEDDPRRADTDGDGLGDGEESLSVLCTPALLGSAPRVSRLPEVESMLALPLTFTQRNFPGVSATTFTNGGTVVGYVVKRDSTPVGIEADNSAVLSAIAEADAFDLSNAQQFDTWFHSPTLPARTAAQSQLVFTYGADSANAPREQRDPVELRDAIITRLLGEDVAFRSGETGEACAALTLHHVSIVRDDALVTAGILTCSENLAEDEELVFLFDDFYNASPIAPEGFDLHGFRCKELHVSTTPRVRLEHETNSDGFPIVSTIRVAVDKKMLPRSRIQGWDYEPNTNTIVFFGQEFTGAENIAVSYLRWEPTQE